MQTLAEAAIEIVSWERSDLPNGAYRLSGAKRLTAMPDIDFYTERIDIAQFTDSFDYIKKILGITGGSWVGAERNAGARVDVLAFRLE